MQAFQVLFGASGLMNPGRDHTPSSTPSWRRSSGRRPTTRRTPALLQEATKIAVTSFPNTFLYAPSVIARQKSVSELRAAPSLAPLSEGISA